MIYLQEILTDSGSKKLLNIAFNGMDTDPKLIFIISATNKAHPNKIKVVLYDFIFSNYVSIVFK